MTSSRIPAPLPGFLLFVGGQCRKVGKSALVEDVIKAFPERNWTAVKITPYVESGCPVVGPACRCSPAEHTFAILEEADRSATSDTSRFLAAGVSRALWVQTKEHRLQDALPSLIENLADARYLIIESDALATIWKPSLFLMVLDLAVPDFKISARENLKLADAFVFRSPDKGHDTLFAPAATDARPAFLQPIGTPLPQALRQFLSGSFP